MKQKKAIEQLKKIEKYADMELRLAAEWDEKWKVLISTILSAQTRDEKTIEVCEKLFKKYPSPEKLCGASLGSIKADIKQINYYKTKAKHIKETCNIISKKEIPSDVDSLLELPGVGRKVANVYLAEANNLPAIGVDTHVARLAKKLGWTKQKSPHKIEKDLERLFPKKYWNKINYVLVRFGRAHRQKDEDEIIDKIRKI